MDYSDLMNRNNLEKPTKGDKPIPKPRTDILPQKGNRPQKPTRRPPPIPEGVKPFKPKRTVKKVVDNRPGMVLNPETNRWIKIGSRTYLKRQKVKPWTIRNPATNRPILIGGPTHRKLFPIKNKSGWVRNPRTNRWIKSFGPTFQKTYLNTLNEKAAEIDTVSKSIDDRYKSILSSLDDVKPKTKITQIRKALKDSTKSFSVDIVDNKDPLIQLTKTRKVIGHHLDKELGDLKGFKCIETLKITFEKEMQLKDTMILAFASINSNKKKSSIIKTAYFNSKTKTIINENEISGVLQSSRQELLKAVAQWISEGSAWTIN